MKKIFMLFLLASFITTGYSQENKTDYKNELRLDGIELFKSTFMLTYERTINDKSSVQLSAGVILKENSYEVKNGGIVEFQYRINRNFKRTLDSIPHNIVVYAGPYIRYRYLDATNTSYLFYSNSLYESNDLYSSKRKLYYFSTISAGALIGIKFSMFKFIFIDLNFGGGIKFTTTNGYKTDKMADEAYTGVTPIGNITFGFKF